MTIEKKTEQLRANIAAFHSEQSATEADEYAGRNTMQHSEFVDLSCIQEDDSWLARSYNLAGEELTFIRENGFHTNTFYYGAYTTTLRHSSFDAEYPESVAHSLKGVSLDTGVSLNYDNNEDGEIKNFHFVASDVKGFYVEASRSSVRVTIYPDHPNYSSYDYPEVEVEPSPDDTAPVMGKLISINL